MDRADVTGRLHQKLLEHPYFWPAVLFVVTLLVRLPFRAAGLSHHDEVPLATAVESTVADGRLAPALHGRYGSVLLNLLFYLPYHLLTGGRADVVLPFTGVLMGAVLVSAVYLLLLELSGDEPSALVGALLLGFCPLFLTTSTTGKEQIPAIAFASLAAWALARASARRSPAWLAAGTLLCCISLLVHEASLTLVPVLAAVLALVGIERHLGWRRILSDLAVLLGPVVLLFAFSLWRHVARNVTVVDSGTSNFLGFFSEVLPEAARDLVGSVGVPTLVLAGAGLVVVLRRRGALLALLPWALLLFYFGNVGSYAPRYLLWGLPPILMLAGLGATWAASFLNAERARTATLAVLTLSISAIGFAEVLPLIARRSERLYLKESALFLRDRTEPDAVVLCMDDCGFVQYYAGRQTMVHPVDDPVAMETFVRRVKLLATSGKGVYAGKYAFLYDEDGTFARQIRANFQATLVAVLLNEWYYRPELEDTSFRDEIILLRPVGPPP